MILQLDLAEYKNEQKSFGMARYMKNKFIFLGISAPLRAQACKTLKKESKSWTNQILLEEIQNYYKKDAREYQYLAIDLILSNYSRISWEEWQRVIFPLIDEKSWWDSVDHLRKPIGLWLINHPKELEQFILEAMNVPSFWQRRVAITVQLKNKQQTNTELLAKAIIANQADNEFFIQKGIGWALREYSKTDPGWVRAFLTKCSLSSLSVREASKYL